MGPMTIAGIVFGTIFLGGLLAVVLRATLPDHHVEEGSKNAVRLVMGLIATFWVMPCLAANAPWTGNWDTRWRGGGARMELTQDGERVIGVYPLYGGHIEAEAKDRRLRGRWIEGDRSGALLFVLAPDGKSFMGRFDTGEWWTGGRAPASMGALAVDQSSVRETMRTFVAGGNLARAGFVDELGLAAAVLDFGDRAATLLPGDKLDAAKALFDVVDLTTFHLWALPDRQAHGPTYPVALTQLGTGAVLPLTLRQDDQGKWWIVAPTADQLAGYRKTLLAPYGGRAPSSDAYLLQHNARDTMSSFLAAFKDWEGPGGERALATLDLSELAKATRDQEGLLAAQYLKLVLDRISQIVPQEIPNDPADRLPYVHFEHPGGRIVIAPVGEGEATKWKFTAETVDSARELFAAIEDMPVASHGMLPPPPSAFFALRERIRSVSPGLLERTWSLENWQLIGIVLIGLFAFLVASGIAAVVQSLLRRDVGTHALAAEHSVRWPLRLALTAIVWRLLEPVLGLPETAREVDRPLTSLVLAIGMVWAGWFLITAFGHRSVERAERADSGMDAMLVSLVLAMFRLALVTGGFLYAAEALSIPYSGLLAGIGIGGLAVALASKEALSNIFGAGVLVADRPFRKGDWIVVGDVQGTVEHVGIRSTRIRTLEDTLIVVPNGKLSEATINNWGGRRHRLLRLRLLLAYSATPSQLDAFIAGLRRLIERCPHGVPHRTLVGVTALSDIGIEVELTGYLDAPTRAEELGDKHRLMLDVLALAAQLGIRIGSERPLLVGASPALTAA
jgi:MscS family membrane protein